MAMESDQADRFPELPQGLLTYPENRVMAYMDDPDAVVAAVEASHSRSDPDEPMGRRRALEEVSARLLALGYSVRRVGAAESDELQRIANSLKAIVRRIQRLSDVPSR